jgi:transcriptional regulator with XRE-family HTH domain
MTNNELKTIRESLKMTKSEFAKELDISPLVLGRYEKGSLEIPEVVAQKALSIVDVPHKKTFVEKLEEGLTALEHAEEITTPTMEKDFAADAKAAPAEEAAAEKKEKKPAKKSGKKSAPVFYIESVMGGQITTKEIEERLPAGVEAVYIKPEENKAYFTTSDGEDGSIELW